MILLSTAYIGNIQYYTKLLSGSAVIDLHENYLKQSYRNRCEIMTCNGVLTLVVPVYQPSGIKTLTKDIRIDNSKRWQHQHCQAIASAYRSSSYFEHYEEAILGALSRECTFLIDLNENMQQVVLNLLGQKPAIEYTKSYIDASPSDDDWRTAISPKQRLRRPDSAFNPEHYYQTFSDRYDFAPNLSIIDLLLCEGRNSGTILGL